MALLDVVERRLVLGLGGLVDVVVLVVARDGDVRRDLDDGEVVDLLELLLSVLAVPVMPASFS